MNNLRFWKDDFGPRDGEPAIRAAAGQMLGVVAPAIEHLEACRKEAAVNADLLDSFLFGARRMELIARRMLDGIAAGQAYADAVKSDEKDAKLEKLAEAERIVRRNRDAHDALGKEFARLWLAESKPYALDWTMKRYAAKVKWFDDLASRLADARQKVKTGQPLPSPAEVGLAFPESK